MDISKIPVGENAPWDVNVIVEVPVGTEPIKYEMDKDSGALFVDRIMHTSMRYPCNYGFIPHTLADDGDPVDVLIANQTPIMPGAVVRCRPIGVLVMEDEAGMDEKLLMVPVDKLNPWYTSVSDYSEMPKLFLERVSHFFAHYKDLEEGKWVDIKGWESKEKAASLIEEGVQAYKAAGSPENI
ncbi:inorganic pyrophosphatase [Kordiimonas sediminis]|uniref:Inorganic pyrophosphatase n=1 Tax=Kordiimonas sediminis TaxID=1735581 RepID=A0A919AXE6_9PROT|nr:inorganic diphosphatase [Kordiimonas sediminis]GHF30208.1 inorganic pyrophosphatase [Kordiimonas sediminis]